MTENSVFLFGWA